MKDDLFNEETLNGLLTELHQDKEEAGELYMLWHTKLVSYFAWRGITTPEECAHEVLRRVGEMIYKGVNIKDFRKYIFGIARNVRFEYYNKNIFEPLEDDDKIVTDLTSELEAVAEKDGKLECLDRCLDSLSLRDREMLLAYYAEGKNIEPRKQLAILLGININTLHLRVHRLRNRLGKCINKCLKQRTKLK